MDLILLIMLFKAFQKTARWTSKTHFAYHPAGGGAAERANQTLKTKLTKLMAETNLSWMEVLPIV